MEKSEQTEGRPPIDALEILDAVARALNESATKTGFEVLKQVNANLQNITWPDGTHPVINLGKREEQLVFKK